MRLGPARYPAGALVVGGPCRIGASYDYEQMIAVRQVLARYPGSTALIPGAGGVQTFGFSPGNYIESTGQTLTPVDGAVGLVVDAAQAMGPELWTSPSIGIGPGITATSSNNGSDFTMTIAASTTGNSATWRQNFAGTNTLAVAYSVSVSALSGNVRATPRVLAHNGSVHLYVDTATYTTTTGVVSRIATAPQGYWLVRLDLETFPVAIGNTGSITFSNISVRELPGIHATQPTTQFKPTLRRGLVNQLLWSSDFSNAAWGAKLNLSLAVTGAAPYGVETTATVTTTGFAVLPQSGVIAQSDRASFAFLVRNTGTHIPSFLIRNNTTATNLSNVVYWPATQTFTGAGTHTSVNLGNGWTLCVLTVATGITAGNSLQFYAGMTGGTVSAGQTHVIGACGAYSGTVTAQQVIAAGGIPVTTTSPASSASGIQSWQFDGTDDRLRLSAVPFQMADDHWVVAGAERTGLGVNETIFEVGDGVSTARVASMGANAGQVNCIWGDGTTARIASNTVVSAAQPYVHAVRKTGNTYTSRLNGVGVSTSGALNSTVSTVATLGARTPIVERLSGHIHPVFFGKGAITDADLLILERFIAQWQGRTL